MKEIQSFNLHRNPQTKLVPTGAKFLCVKLQDNQIVVWAILDPNLPSMEVKFTGIKSYEPIMDNHGEYCGSVLVPNGEVEHIFAKWVGVTP